ncbi:MAG TPA: HAMP domain-containing sensor histidine kinase [Spirochaetota bacterium]|nr:HAMP domain-containing sensor histidine kinase [Spirochaetota bacterium]HPJ34728.1 HAMP domain-containing sensor histidine kinase [Spirochaetota bacterium]
MSSVIDIYSVINSLELPAAGFDGELILSYASSAFSALTGIDADSGQSINLSDIADEKTCESIRQILSSETDDRNSTIDVLFSNGNNVVSSEAVLLRAAGDNSKSGVLCILKSSAAEGEYNKELQKELRKLRAVCIFTGGAAHDYNNALTAVMGNISLARLEAEGNQELMELLRDAEKASSRIRTMTERVSLFSRGIRVEKKKSSVEEVVKNSLSSALRGYGGLCNLEMKDPVPDLEIDPALVSEALTGIIENAREAAPLEGGRIDVSVYLEEVRTSAGFQDEGAVEGDYVKISVKDNGSGFKPEDSVRMFDPYYTTKDDREGIGLALAYSIIKRHRGFISASISKGGGSLFSVYIPLF